MTIKVADVWEFICLLLIPIILTVQVGLLFHVFRDAVESLKELIKVIRDVKEKSKS